jgi:hypothetical protein
MWNQRLLFPSIGFQINLGQASSLVSPQDLHQFLVLEDIFIDIYQS